MGVRKTESRIPASLQPSDLGHAVASADGRCTLVAFSTSPIVAGRDNTYVLFVTDAGLAASAQSFEWTFTESGEVARIDTTDRGATVYQPSAIGPLSVSVRILDAGAAEHAAISIDQDVVLPSAELETLIADARNQPGPGASNPEALRELVNEHSRYYQAVAPQSPEPGEGFARFTFGMVLDGALRRTAVERRQQLERFAEALNDNPADFGRLAVEGVGVANIRLPLLAMTVPPGGGATLLPWTELPEAPSARAFADEQLRAALASLADDARIDLFNIARFPKSNITHCGRILEALRNKYFAGASFDDVLTGMSGTRAHWIMRHYHEGPLVRS
jgi:hypothetical protein